MWNLAINLPIMIDDTIPMTAKNGNTFFYILQLCTAPVTSSAHAGILGRSYIWSPLPFLSFSLNHTEDALYGALS